MFNELKKEGEIKNRMKRSNILLIPFTPIRLARDKEVGQYQVLQRMKINGNPYTLLMRIYIDSITLESNQVLAYKVYHSHTLSSVQFSSVTQSCPTLCNPMNPSTPGLPVHHQLLEFTHVHRVSDAIQPSHPLSSPSPPVPNPSQHQGLFQ